MGQYTGDGRFASKGGRFAPKGGPFCVELTKSFYFYDIIYFTTKISVYREFEVCMVMDQFQRVPFIDY